MLACLSSCSLTVATACATSVRLPAGGSLRRKHSSRDCSMNTTSKIQRSSVPARLAICDTSAGVKGVCYMYSPLRFVYPAPRTVSLFYSYLLPRYPPVQNRDSARPRQRSCRFRVFIVRDIPFTSQSPLPKSCFRRRTRRVRPDQT